MKDSRLAWAVFAAVTAMLVSTTAQAQEDYKGKTWLRLEAAATTDFGLNLDVAVPASAATSVSLGSRGNLRVGLEAPMGVAVLLRLGVRSLSTSTTFQSGAPEQDGSGTLWALGLEGRYYPMNCKRTQAFGFLESSKSGRPEPEGRGESGGPAHPHCWETGCRPSAWHSGWAPSTASPTSSWWAPSGAWTWNSSDRGPHQPVQEQRYPGGHVRRDLPGLPLLTQVVAVVVLAPHVLDGQPGPAQEPSHEAGQRRVAVVADPGLHLGLEPHGLTAVHREGRAP